MFVFRGDCFGSVGGAAGGKPLVDLFIEGGPSAGAFGPSGAAAAVAAGAGPSLRLFNFDCISLMKLPPPPDGAGAAALEGAGAAEMFGLEPAVFDA